ncbi:MAG: GntR family transcriptional regulator [Firmicutes bacterium]|uniref:GntR family transcriptional regulator n=1 Tax=Candidatus Scybalomonas excrementavium TaxID=2840943 RepID=A0A9D9I1I4_9FIRM|nr:GntR family transcriptional regulator [Candidatus Scybalomonas excrementavium]
MLMEWIEIDFQSSEAIYLQLRNQIIIGIATKQLQDGESLPSVRQMADCLGVNMHTVNKAYGLLKQDGYLQLDRRKGAVISVQVSTDKHSEVEALHENMQMLVAEAICKDISKEEFYQAVGRMYDVFYEQKQMKRYNVYSKNKDDSK